LNGHLVLVLALRLDLMERYMGSRLTLPNHLRILIYRQKDLNLNTVL